MEEIGDCSMNGANWIVPLNDETKWSIKLSDVMNKACPQCI